MQLNATSTLSGKTLVITGASRGIGLEIAKRCARDGANIVIFAKTVEPHPKLPGTIYTAAAEIEEAGGQVLPLCVDIRDDEAVQSAFVKAGETFGGIDALVNNASAIYLLGPQVLKMKQYDVMHEINARGSYLCSTMALPYLLESTNPHIVNISPPINMHPGWFKSHVAYTQSKYLMSMSTLGMAEALKPHQVAVNSLWPRTAIDTAAVRHLLPGAAKNCRKPEIMADAAYWILTQRAALTTGQFFIDEEIVRSQGVEDLSEYALDPNEGLLRDLFIGDPHDAGTLLGGSSAGE
tara:strand:- start:279 stop:1160 length:882 start_codon:yes stop_codon:yes gene_type:complete